MFCELSVKICTAWGEGLESWSSFPFRPSEGWAVSPGWEDNSVLSLWDETNDLCSQDKDRNMTNGTHRDTESKNNYHESRWLRLTPSGSSKERRVERTLTNGDIRSVQTQTSRTCNLENNPPENCNNIVTRSTPSPWTRHYIRRLSSLLGYLWLCLILSVLIFLTGVGVSGYLECSVDTCRP